MFQERIQSHYEMLSPRFRTLADFILENTLDVGFMTATALAQEVGVDPATVVRFAQELGYSGFRELSREIKTYINHQLALRYGRETPEAAGLQGELTQLLDELSIRILDMKVDAAKLSQVVALIRDARRIVITGTASGLGLAEMWATHLKLIGRSVESVPADPSRTALALRDLGPEDLLIVIAVGLAPGTQLGPVLQAAAERGAQTVSITASPTLLPARESDVNLVVPAETPSGYPSFDTIAVVLSILWQALISETGANAHRHIGNTVENLVRLTNGGDKLTGYDSAALLRLWKQV